ncbi:MAG: hypothetical protein NTY19_50195 [Planctomycetota bacterium]|nr:hypothetical protein [Planctomycetota bacterium]
MIHDEPDGAIYDASVSYDARTIFFSANRLGVEGDWHIYEIGVDGRGLRQLTRGPSANISPVLLPDDRIMFVSTRHGTYVQCQPATAGLLHVMDRDGGNVQRVSANIDSDQSPQLLDDGQVLFTRWDYGIEKNVFARHALWTMNPDGSGLDLFFGNTIEDPNAFWTAVPIPHRPEVVCVFGPHHTNQAGSIGLVWNQLGQEAPRGEGFRWLTREVPSQGDLAFPHGYSRPWPIHECLFLCSYGGDGQQRNRLYLVDDRGNRQCIYEDDQRGCWNPLPLRPRPMPPVIASRARDNECTTLAGIAGLDAAHGRTVSEAASVSWPEPSRPRPTADGPSLEEAPGVSRWESSRPAPTAADGWQSGGTTPASLRWRLLGVDAGPAVRPGAGVLPPADAGGFSCNGPECTTSGSTSEGRTGTKRTICDTPLPFAPESPATTVTIHNVYQGLEGYVRRGEARYVQVME